MKTLIKGLPSAAIRAAFGLVYAITLLMALCPPLYLAASGVRTSVLGIPFSVFYWIADAAIAGLALWALYAVENIRGELDEEITPAVSAAVGRTEGSIA
ncbi:hypothetical protein ACIPC1_28850 [Streptomyces sp. NPDC087263]|uniref:hypothetical protein n=1 Tax=Streptomyces sp. NPDC087263 TaxID=3365773 RepID=UPI00380363F4